MLKFVIPVVMLLVGTGAGVGVALFLSDGDEDVAEHESDEHQESDEDESYETDDHDTGAHLPVRPGSTSDFEYVRLNNQFVVPVIRDDRVQSLVVLSLSIEVEIGNNQLVFDREPRLRDAFLRVMFRHANAGAFDGMFTDPHSLNPLRRGLRDSARQILGPIVNDILIVDIVRQDS